MRCQGTSVGNYTSQKFEIHFITTVSLLQSPYYIIHKRIYYIRGPKEKSKRLNKLESNILKPKNQVTLFVNYSYNSFHDLCSSENIYSERNAVCQNMGFLILIGATYEHTFNRYPCEWSSYLNTLLMLIINCTGAC